jgi:uncharacterized RDD family membrane protein YckC
VSAYQAPVDPTNVGGKRIVSAIIDVGIAWVIYYVLFVALSKPDPPVFVQTFAATSACGGEAFCSNINGRHVSGGALLLLFAIFSGYMVGVFVVQRGLTGKTLGTMAMGVVTVSDQGTPLGIPKALGRSVAGIVDYLPCCLPLVGIITIFATKGHRRIGDMAVKSFVVDKQWAGQPIAVAGISAAAANGPYAQPYAQPGYAPPPPMLPAQPTYGAPASPTWEPPIVEPEPVMPEPIVAEPVPTAAPASDPTQPQWDAARNAYIQWDPTGQTWLQFNDATQQWGPIS